MSSLPLPSRLRKPAKFTVNDVMIRKGYIFVDGFGGYASMFYPAGTTRQQIKQRAVEPVLKLRTAEINRIQEWAQTEDDILIGALAIHDTGNLPDPIQQRIEAEIEKRMGATLKRLKELEEREVKLKLELEAKADQEAMEAEKKAAEAEAKKPEAKKPK